MQPVFIALQLSQIPTYCTDKEWRPLKPCYPRRLIVELFLLHSTLSLRPLQILLCLGVVLSCVADAAHLHSDHTLTADGYSFSLSQVREWINGINSRTPIDESRSLAAWTYR